MNRKGYPIISVKKKHILQSLDWEYDYITFQNEFFLSDVYSVYPEIISKISKIADNGAISVCIHPDSTVNQTLNGYLGLEDKSPVFESIMTYDTVDVEFWQHTQSTSELSYSGNNSGMLTPDMPYGLTYKTKDLTAITEGQRTLSLSSFFLRDSSISCEIVLTISENGENIYYKSYNLKELITVENIWERVDLIYQLPHIRSEDYEFALYLWNTGESRLFVDDFAFKIY